MDQNNIVSSFIYINKSIKDAEKNAKFNLIKRIKLMSLKKRLRKSLELFNNCNNITAGELIDYYNTLFYDNDKKKYINTRSNMQSLKKIQNEKGYSATYMIYIGNKLGIDYYGLIYIVASSSMQQPTDTKLWLNYNYISKIGQKENILIGSEEKNITNISYNNLCPLVSGEVPEDPTDRINTVKDKFAKCILEDIRKFVKYNIEGDNILEEDY